MVQLERMHVPEAMRGRGVSSALAREVLNHMTQNNVYVDIKCPITQHYIKHNQSAQYVRSMVEPRSLKQNKSTPR